MNEENLDCDVYAELRKIASGLLLRERGNHTLQPTALVHEAYVRVGASLERSMSRPQVLSLAVAVMKNILTDYARRHRATKRSGEGTRVELAEGAAITARSDVDLFDFTDALDRLGSIEARLGRVAQMRLLGDMKLDEIAAVEDVSVRTIKSDWRAAKTWLHDALGS